MKPQEKEHPEFVKGTIFTIASPYLYQMAQKHLIRLTRALWDVKCAAIKHGDIAKYKKDQMELKTKDDDTRNSRRSQKNPYNPLIIKGVTVQTAGWDESDYFDVSFDGNKGYNQQSCYPEFVGTIARIQASVKRVVNGRMIKFTIEQIKSDCSIKPLKNDVVHVIKRSAKSALRLQSSVMIFISVNSVAEYVSTNYFPFQINLSLQSSKPYQSECKISIITKLIRKDRLTAYYPLQKNVSFYQNQNA